MSVGARRIRVMVVEDQEVVREGIAALVGMHDDMEVVASVGDGTAAIAAFRAHRPDVTLMDLRMPGLDGADAIATVRSEFPGSRFIVLTTFEGDEDIYRALKAGAQGYMLKGARSAELMAAIRDVHRGLRRVPPELADKALQRVADDALTPRERDVLTLMARGQSNKHIAAALEIAESTVKKHVNAVLLKLGAEGRTEAVVTAVRRGLVRVD